MKKIFTTLTAILITVTLWAQSPEKMNYQAVIRDTGDNLVTNQSVGMQISILQGSTSGTVVYAETHAPVTNTNGLISIEIGNGAVQSGDLTTIAWANGPYFIKTETDPSGGTSYSITGTSQLLSVPYALHAKTAETITGGITETDPVYTTSEAANITATDINNLGNLSGTNTGDQDISGIATNAQAIQDTASQIRADIPDVSGFISSETDPEFTAWDKDYADLTNTPTTITTAQADAITANTGKDTTGIYHTNRIALDLVSGTNTGDQDITGIAVNEQAIQDTAAQIRTTLATALTYVDELEQKIEILELKVELNSGASVSDLLIAGASISNLLSAGVSVPDLLTAGASVPDLLTGGASVTDLLTAGASESDFIGAYYQGGIIFYIDATDGSGLVCAVSDQSSSIQWYNGSWIKTDVTATAVGTGQANTATIVSYQGSGSYAAQICADLDMNGYSDWFLPSKDELNLMYTNKLTIDATAIANSGSSLASAFYWSSSESDTSNGYGAWRQNIGSGSQKSSYKSFTSSVRAVRAF